MTKPRPYSAPKGRNRRLPRDTELAKPTPTSAPARGQRAVTGTVYWITGLSGSGKTTLGRRLARRLKRENVGTLFLDGDVLRNAMGRDLGYALADRRKAAMRIARLCRVYSDQGLDVVASTISLFHDVHRFCRRNIPGYVEIYLDVSIDELLRRDPRGLYSRALAGELNDVVGVDLPMEAPETAEVHLVASNETAAKTMTRLWDAVQDIRRGAAVK